jgi:hypothetical protein
MFQNEDLKNHLETSSVVSTQTAVIAEWNMNIPTNIFTIGNYRYRPTSTKTSDQKYRGLPNTFDAGDDGKFYTGATDADVRVDGGFDDSGSPSTLTPIKEQIKMLYSLEDCFKPFRPRSGINKARYMPGHYIHNANVDMARRPRYYIADKNDGFKYWSSYRTEGGTEYGISSNNIVSGRYVIEDAVPFVVYNKNIPANRLVVKMQTNVGNIQLGTSDPFYGDEKRSVPNKWKVQVLKENNWVDILSFNEGSKRLDGTNIIKSDGYVELSYGLKVPDKYKDIFIYAETLMSETLKPAKAVNGYAYLIKSSESDLGTFHIWNKDKWETFIPTYGWYLEEETVDRLTNFVTDLTSPISYTSSGDGTKRYREFEYIRGVRIVVDNMVKPSATLDLIEISPRLCVNLTDKVTDISIKKSASDLGTSGMPVGQLLASTGSLTLFDYDESFNTNNPSSIVRDYITRNLQIKIYDIIVNVGGYDYFVPIKTMYVEGFPSLDNKTHKVSLNLRDLYFYFESMTAPQILSTSVSLSSAVSLLLDSIGFSNYVFKRVAGETEIVIPYFYIPPDKSIAQVLQDLAVSSQTSMFFDEYNNFVMMSKNYMMPTLEQRSTDITLYGSADSEDSGVIKNNKTNNKLANIVEITTQDNQLYNDGKISYSSKYIQRSVGSIKQASLIDNEQSWIYKPVVLWEVAGSSNTKSVNGNVGQQSTYVLSAIPLNSSLSNIEPYVSNNQIRNNTIDFGEGVYWITRYSGYFYSNGEIIKYDAVEYSVPGVGNVWINNVQEYEYYFSKLPFNGKIYPTGLVRIFTEPNYEEVEGVLRLRNGAVAKHGRSQFGTQITSHVAGLDPYWSNNANVRGCNMKSEFLFNPLANSTLTNVNSTGTTLTVYSNSSISVGQQLTMLSGTGKLSSIEKTLVVSKPTETTIVVSPAPTAALVDATIYFETLAPSITVGPAGINNSLAQQSTRNGIIKNFFSSNYIEDSKVRAMLSTQSGTLQSSALVMTGPGFTSTEKPRDFVSYVYKKLTDRFTHFGTRVRIVGKIENDSSRGQTPVGSTAYYVIPGTTPDKDIKIIGGSGGMAVMINPDSNVGYYFEIVALGASSLTSEEQQNVNNILFYKVGKSGISDASPVILWQGLSNIIVDDGKFTGQYRMVTEENPTVYDLAVEYQDIGSFRKFFLYVNNNLVATAIDENPTPAYNNMALFTRGSSRVMFENIYAVTNNYSQNTAYSINTPINSIFGDDEINASESLRKYAMSGAIQSTYLSGISPSNPPAYNIYFEEFGTIMREASSFNIKYDQAYPALYAKMSPTFNSIKGYTVSGFRAGSYGAEFLIFNATDTALSLDETTGNYLKIQGVTFTQQSNNDLTVDDYFSKNSDFSDPQFIGSNLVSSPLKVKKDYEDIKVSRLTYGTKDFSLNVPYVQTADDANDLMKWMVSKIMKPRTSIGIKIFANPTIQLGDIVNVDYVEDGINKVGSKDKRFVVYNIDYSKSLQGPNMTIYVSEVA